MRRHNTTSYFIAAAILVGIGALMPVTREMSAQSPATQRQTTITVREGTSMAIALSPDKTRIVLDLQGGLWIVPVTGGEAKRITDEYGDARQPAWSPDGRTIAFQSYRDGTWRIWTVGPDGTNLKPITSGPFDDREPHWSPDGSRIVFSSDRSGNYDLWILELASGAVRQLTTDAANDFFPSWSPDGTEIAFVSTRASAPGVYAIAVTGDKGRLIASTSGAVGTPSWSPDGKVLFSVIPGNNAPPGEDVSRLVLDGRVIASGEDYFPFRAQWLTPQEFLYPADGRIKHRSTAGENLKATDFSATMSLTLPTYARKRRTFDSIGDNRVLGILRPVIAPGGRELAFAALGDLWLMPIGGTPKRITDDPFVETDAAWSPDGSQLAFVSDRLGSMDVWVRTVASGQDRRLTSLPDAEMAPVWSPDGATIAFISNQAYEQGELMIVPAAGGEPRRINSRIFGAGYPSWTADGRFIVTSALKPYSSRYREAMNYYWAVPLDGTEPVMIVPKAHEPIGKRAGDGPAVSPDGRLIAFVANNYLYVQPIGPEARPTGPARQVTRELSDSISWAGSNQLLYMATDRLKLVNVNDGAAQEIAIDLTWRRKVPVQRTVVHAARLIDGVTSSARTDMDIVIERNRIASIVPHSAVLHIGTVVDASQQSVMPGLIEGHGHNLKEHGDLFGRVHLAYGVTAFRNVGGIPYDALEDREAIDSGRRLGPRAFVTGYLLDGWRPYYPMASTAPDASVVDMEIERARRLDYDMFKTYVRLPDTLQKRAIEGAHRIGIPTSSHEIYPAALVGGDSVEHTGATSRRGYSTKQSGMGRAYEDVIQIVSKSGMTLTPTLGLGGFQAAVNADPTILDDPRWQLLQPAWTRASVRPQPGRGPRAITEGQKTVLKLQRAGATIIAGVDSPLTPYAVALHFELQDYVAAGMTPLEAIRTATINTARLMGAGDDLGTLEVGKLADMVIVDGNPLVDIKDTLRVRTVIKNGEAYTMQQLLDVPQRPAPRRDSSSARLALAHVD